MQTENINIPSIDNGNSNSSYIIDNSKNQKVLKDKSLEETKIGSEDIKIDKTELTETIERINSAFQIFDTNIKMSLNKNSNGIIIEIFDLKSEKVIREFPPERISELSEKVKESIGIIVDDLR